jgi:diguanylate cyclase (GGDEF)-like protein
MLDVTVVSMDPTLLRDTFWWLSAFGCEVRSLRDFERLMEVWAFSPPDILIVDADHPNMEQAVGLNRLGPNGYTYTIALSDPTITAEKLEVLVGTFDDVVSKPLNGGEVIARLRAGVRYREFERRIAQRSSQDRTTGLASQSGLLIAMNKSAVLADEQRNEVFAVILASLDNYTANSACYGLAARNAVLRQAATIFAELRQPGGVAARLRTGEFCLLLQQGSGCTAEEVANRLRSRLAETDFTCSGGPQRLTATICIAHWTPACGQPFEALRAAVRTLRHAKALGGDSVVQCGEFDEAFKEWQEKSIKVANTFSNLTARDIMTPFTVVWRQGAACSNVSEAIHSSGVTIVPYVDEDDNYVGILPRDAFKQAESQFSNERVDKPIAVPEDLSFIELAELFTTGDERLVVVLRGRQPLGYVTCEAMVNLIEPVDADAYSHTEFGLTGSKYLIVEEVPCASA